MAQSPTVDTVFADALRLSPGERLELRLLVTESLEGAEFTLSPAWQAEIERRLARIEDGTAEFLDDDEADAIAFGPTTREEEQAMASGTVAR